MFDININLSLFDKIETGEAGEILAKKISEVMGGAFASRLAKEQAKSLEIKNKSNLDDLYARAELRAACQRIKEQEQMESIIKQAIGQLPPDASTENIQKMDEDWISYFFRHCAIISNKNMQLLWAKILAGEANNNGEFSKKTLSVISDMSQEDAKLFTSFCQFVWDDIWAEQNALETNRLPRPLIYDISNIIYTDKGIDLNALEHLNALGLINLTGKGYTKIMPTTTTQDEIQANSVMCYFDEVVLVLQKTKGSNPPMPLGKCLLTKSGEELSRICGAQKNYEFFNYVITEWKKKNLNPVVRTPVAK